MQRELALAQGLRDFIVLYRYEPEPDELFDFKPLAFKCMATDAEHAAEQCQNAYPDGDVVFIHAGQDVTDALKRYHAATPQERQAPALQLGQSA